MKYTETHEWIQTDSKIATIGITEHAQKELGDVVYIELPKVGHKVKAGDEIVVIESTKAAIDLYSPLTGEITAVNATLKEHPEKVNTHPESEGWLYQLRIDNPKELDSLMDVDTYQAYLAK